MNLNNLILKGLFLSFLTLPLTTPALAAITDCLFVTTASNQRYSKVIQLRDVFVPPNSDLATYSFTGQILGTEINASVIDGIYSAYLKNGFRTAKQDFQDSITLKLNIGPRKDVFLQCPYPNFP